MMFKQPGFSSDFRPFSLARFFVFFQPSSQMVRLFTLATFYDHISFIAAVTFGINTVFFRLNCYLTVFLRFLNKFCPIFFLPPFKKLLTDSSTSILKCGVTDYFLCLSLLILLPHKRITRDFACLYCDIFPLCWNRSRQPVSYPVFLLSMQPAKITVDRHTFHNATHLAHAQSFFRSAYNLKRLVSTSLTMEVPVVKWLSRPPPPPIPKRQGRIFAVLSQ